MNTSVEPRQVAAVHELAVVASDGVRLSVRVHRNPVAAVRLVVSHGNGLAAAGFRAFWEPLCRNHEVVLFDFRGHGQSDAGEAANHSWEQFSRDYESVWQALQRLPGPTRTLGAMHSMSAVTALLHLKAYGPRWDGLVLFDPSLSPPLRHRLAALHADEMARRAERTRRRRRRFAEPGELAEQFGRRDRFGAWAAGAPMDMALATLRPLADGWALCCDPEREAHIFLSNVGLPVWDVLEAPPCPIHIVAGDPDRPDAEAPSLASRAAHEDAGVGYEAIGGTGHFLQLEAPERCRLALERCLAGARAGGVGPA
jgi:pimeloyl-ACP methyl ester carboxylesterase